MQYQILQNNLSNQLQDFILFEKIFQGFYSFKVSCVMCK